MVTCSLTKKPKLYRGKRKKKERERKKASSTNGADLTGSLHIEKMQTDLSPCTKLRKAVNPL